MAGKGIRSYKRDLKGRFARTALAGRSVAKRARAARRPTAKIVRRVTATAAVGITAYKVNRLVKVQNWH